MTASIGQPITRIGGRERVTGAQQYVGDIHLEGMLHVKLVSLNCAHALILSIDTRQAEQLDGVRCVLTAQDLPEPVPRFGPVVNDRPVLASGETKFFGEPVAAVAAVDEDTAQTAAALIQVEYQELPGVYTIEDALEPGAPLVQDPSLRNMDDPLKETNVHDAWQFGWGEIDGQAADLVIDQIYRFPMVTHFPIENLTYLAAPEKDGVAIWSPIQHPYVLQRVIASVLKIPAAKVRVIAPDPGGGFGGKGYPKYEPLMAFLALKTGCPVRLALTLEETFQAIRRASARIHMRTGFTDQGRLAFQEVEADFLVGAYMDISGRVVSKASYVACGPYRTPNARIIGRAVLSHTVPSTAFRGFGIPQLAWAIESQMNDAAERLGIDRLEIRLRNLPQKGETLIPNDTPVDGDWAALLLKAARAIDWGKPLVKNHGQGLAMGLKNSASASASFAIVRLLQDGSVLVLSGTSDMGQGARTIFAQIAADELGVPLERISIVMGDTATVPFDASTSASRSSVFMGKAIAQACQKIKAGLVELAAESFTIPASEVAIRDGKVCLPGSELAYDELIRHYYGPVRGEVIGVGSTRGQYLPDHPIGGKAAFWEVVGVACEVEVDQETGEMTITRLAIASDVGKALNPKQVKVQDDGAGVMGLGHTLMEHLILDERGCISNLGALDYRIPTIKDIPLEMISILQENGDGPGPYGAKGVGESGILAIAPAVGAAVNQALGIRVSQLPLTPERIWLALQERGSDGASAPA